MLLPSSVVLFIAGEHTAQGLGALQFRPFVAGRGTPSRTQVGSCLTLGNESFEETHVLTKQETLFGRGARAESSRVREPRRPALPRGSQSRVLW